MVLAVAALECAGVLTIGDTAEPKKPGAIPMKIAAATAHAVGIVVLRANSPSVTKPSAPPRG